jgi:hypothetical protein
MTWEVMELRRPGRRLGGCPEAARARAADRVRIAGFCGVGIDGGVGFLVVPLGRPRGRPAGGGGGWV